ncbi:MAG: type I-F CRISPR-associated protein Csy2 [Saccharospirillum sp.]|nr:type I-F CRISPR-associated protein Csy2 [Saccharospirillum sp.]
MTDLSNLLVIPRLRVQNANTISSNLTWGFPAMSAFVGIMQALERKAIAAGINVLFDGIGVVCHHHEAQVSRGGFVRTFNLTRNPVDKTGKTSAIVEEGRIHLDISLAFGIRGADLSGSKEDKQQVAESLNQILQTMRIAGGVIVPPMPGTRAPSPYISKIPEDSAEQYKDFLSLRRRLMPGFALVLRDDLLQSHFQSMAAQDPEVTQLDAWLDLSRLNMECEEDKGEVEWQIRMQPGWLVPIPVGYSKLSELYKPGVVANARDATTPFRFVESLYSIGQWISPHRLKHPSELLWYVENDLDQGMYRLQNVNEQQNHHEVQEI